MFDLTFIRSVRTAKNIRKTWNTDIIIVCQNFIGLYVCIPNFKANFLFFWRLYGLVFFI